MTFNPNHALGRHALVAAALERYYDYCKGITTMPWSTETMPLTRLDAIILGNEPLDDTTRALLLGFMMSEQLSVTQITLRSPLASNVH